jgi:mRNA interferase HigB
VIPPADRCCGVRIISKRRLRQYWESRKHDSEVAQRDLSTWYKLVKNAAWANFGALKQTLGSADQVGDCVVFDVGNNRFLLIGRINYVRGIVYVLRVMDHAEYDKSRWADDCGCHKPPPKKRAAAKKAPPKGNSPRRGLRGRR